MGGGCYFLTAGGGGLGVLHLAQAEKPAGDSVEGRVDRRLAIHGRSAENAGATGARHFHVLSECRRINAEYVNLRRLVLS